MFPHQKRISRIAFPSILSGGRRISSTHFSATFLKEAGGYAVVVPKKIAHLSVTRHRIKRRVLGALQALQPPQFALILFPKASVADMTYKEVQAELTRLLSKIR